MSKTEIHDKAWLRVRLNRHSSELFKLGWPVMLSRLGIVTLMLVDTVMVGAYSTTHLAYLNLGTGTFIMLYLVVAAGLLLGTLIHTADAFGKGDKLECGAILGRSLPYSFGLGLLMMALSVPAEQLFLWNGQTPELAREGGKVMQVLGFGLVGHLIFLTCASFLEGITRPKPVMTLMIVANALNIFLNYALVFGEFGFPELGAVGSAWSTTLLRTAMMIGVLAYIFLHPSFREYQIGKNLFVPWSSWKDQRMKGYAAGFSLGVEVAAFASLTIFAGWLGTIPLAAYGVVFSVMTIPFMMAAGIGAATSVRVGIAKGRGDKKDTALAGWTGYGLGTVLLIICSIPIYVFQDPIMNFYSDDPALIAFGAVYVGYCGFILIVDGGQSLLANALRGLGETWIPTFIQTFVYIVLMIPLAYWLAIPAERGVQGLLESIFYASVVSVLLQGYRFRHKTRNAYPLVDNK